LKLPWKIRLGAGQAVVVLRLVRLVSGCECIGHSKESIKWPFEDCNHSFGVRKYSDEKEKKPTAHHGLHLNVFPPLSPQFIETKVQVVWQARRGGYSNLEVEEFVFVSHKSIFCRTLIGMARRCEAPI